MHVSTHETILYSYLVMFSGFKRGADFDDWTDIFPVLDSSSFKGYLSVLLRVKYLYCLLYGLVIE